MGLWAGLGVKPCIEPIKLNQKSKVEPIKLNIDAYSFDFVDLKKERILPIDTINKQIEKYADKSREQYELLVLSELHNRGYDLLRLENSDCWRNIQPISENCEIIQFYVDGVLVLTVKQTTRFEDIDHKYMIYTDYEIE